MANEAKSILTDLYHVPPDMNNLNSLLIMVQVGDTYQRTEIAGTLI